MASPRFPEPPPALPATPLAEVDAVVAKLVAHRDRWVRVDIPQRIALMRRCMQDTLAVAQDWVDVACRAKGIAAGTSLCGQEWLGGPMPTVRNLQLFIDALEAGGQPRPPALRTRPDGAVVAQVFPRNLVDRLLFTGFEAEVWIEPGKPATQGRIYREKATGAAPAPGRVALVLGAGNVSSIGAMDALYKLIVEDEVVILKTNPVNAYLGPIYERAFAALIEEGVFAVVHGGAEVGQHLCSHPDIASVHITGSDRTHDAIVWGADPADAAARKAAGTPMLQKPISSELGCVTPVLIVPGPWSDDDLRFQARQVASMVENNGSFNCNAAKVLVLPRGWDRRDAFVAAVRDALRATPARKPYYPGAVDRYKAFLEHYPQAEPLIKVDEGLIPWTLIPDVPAKAGEYALTNEAFCGVLALVDLDATEPVDFLDKAVAFANDVVWGTLSCSLIIHPRTASAHADALDRAIEDLRYGGVAVNAWAAVVYALGVTTWGAFPGHTLEDIRSGRGVVHNGFLFDHPQKSVVKAPFRIKPTPAWFSDHKNLAELGARLTAFEANPGLLGVPRVALAALSG